MFALEMQSVYKSFGNREILCGMNLQVRIGETMVILGPSGTGKSVSLKHLTGLLDPDKGQCLVKGEAISYTSSKKKAQLRSKLGVLFQSGALINWLTVFENVALPLREKKIASGKEIERIVMEKLEWLDLAHAKDTLPADISGGMKKRVGLARALTSQPEIVLYDEPTSGLDPVMSNVINELVMRLQKELHLTSVVVTHDLESAFKIADRISFLFRGKVLFCGTALEIQKSEDPIIQQFLRGSTVGPITQDQLKNPKTH